MWRRRHVIIPTLYHCPIGVTTKFNDTGITASQCYQAASDVLVACSSTGAMALNNAQDGMAGRDAYAVTNSSPDGKLGFSFANVPAIGIDTGGCVQDNVTGLMWEVKTTDSLLRDWRITYTNYDSITALQKSNGTVAPTQTEIDAATNSVGFKNSVNTQGLCGHSDWRLPTAAELQSIVDYSVATPEPTVDAIWFPNTQGLTGLFWSATPWGYPSKAWEVYFSNGEYAVSNRDIGHFVRLVRAGQPQTPPRYTVSADGQEVTDNQTTLIWRRCSEGMNWDGATCASVANTFTHEAALQRAAAQATSTGIAWRLPNARELASISIPSTPIDPTAFPAMPASLWAIFWSASPYVNDPRYAWLVDFVEGSVNFGSRSNAYYVRLVRAGQ